MELLHLLLVLDDIRTDLHDLRLHVLLLQALLYQLAHENLLLLLEVLLVNQQLLCLFFLLFKELVRGLNLRLEFLDVVYEVVVLVLDLLVKFLFVINSLVEVVDLLLLPLFVCFHDLDLRFDEHSFFSNSKYFFVDGIGQLFKPFDIGVELLYLHLFVLHLFLELFSLLLVLLLHFLLAVETHLHSFCVTLQFLKVRTKMLHSLAEVLVTFV